VCAASKTVSVRSSDAALYLGKAREFLDSASDSHRARRWNAAGLAAVHATISYADAVLVHVAAVRSTAADHAAVVDLLEERVTAFGGAAKRQITGALRMKNVVEYEQRMITEVESRRLVDQATRFGAWAETVTGDGVSRPQGE
jgi:hypothetical protein